MAANLQHVIKSVARHNFCDPSDWAIGLDELADMSEQEIEAVAVEANTSIVRHV